MQELFERIQEGESRKLILSRDGIESDVKGN